MGAVDAANSTGATALYEAVGMRVVKRLDVWERALDPSAVTATSIPVPDLRHCLSPQRHKRIDLTRPTASGVTSKANARSHAERSRKMRAIVCTRYGPPDVLRLRQVPKPVPKDDEVLIRIRATTAATADCELRRFDFAPWIWLPMRLGFGISRPRRKVLGQELAGDVESVGKDVRSFAVGDRVFGTTGIGLGAYAEYICLRENPQTGAIATMPAKLGYEEAAAVPYGGGEALEFLRKGNVGSGQRVLVNGAGGSFGTFAVQLAKVLGAHVTAVDGAPKLEMLRAIGADRVIDYSREAFTDGSETWDVIFDVVRGTPSGSMVRSLNEDGCLLMANPGFLQIVRAKWAARGSKKRVSFTGRSGTGEDLAYLGSLVEEGKLHPVIDRRFRLEQMAEAHRYAETGRKLGNIVITVDRGEGAAGGARRADGGLL